MKIPDPPPRFLVRFHFSMLIVWVLLVIPTGLIWRDSILWIGFMSIYAIIVSHFTGWDAARAEEAVKETD
jgi:hypothetical protein